MKRPHDDHDPAKITIYLPAEVHRAIKIEAAQRGMTMSDIVLEALQSRSLMLPTPSPSHSPR